jgi:hypothetical protein
MREQEEEEARRRQAAAQQAQEEIALSGLDSRGGVWSSKTAAAPVPLKEIMMQQQETAVISTGTPRASENKPAQPLSQQHQPLSLKEIQAEQLRAAEQEKQARAQQKVAAAAPVVVHVPVAVIAPKEVPKETLKTPTSSKGKQLESPKASVTGVWGAPAAAPSLKDIQAEQLRQAELQKEQQRAQQQAQRVAASPSFANVAASAVVSQPLSLKEIQAEELRSKQSTQRTVSASPAVLPPTASVLPSVPNVAPQMPAKSAATSAGLAPKKLQGSATPSSAPAPAPASVAASAVDDDDDIVWDYSSKPIAKSSSR